MSLASEGETGWLAKYDAQFNREKEAVKFCIPKKAMIRNFEDEILLRRRECENP